ncbi:MAG TPA: DUF899 domain-containing protein [Nitrospiria bacterium]|nr:DUF899 domain-containing protein [Nitrospiria bacterium]
MKNKIVSQKEWIKARKLFLKKEKAFTKLRDKFTEKIRRLPWVKIEKEYWFQGPNGRENLRDLFGKQSQLIVYHFMLGPDWDQGCKGCSFWADNFQGIPVHLAHRDVSFVAISRATLEKIESFRKRMDWNFKWVSSYGSDFNYDFNVSFTDELIKSGNAVYNFVPDNSVDDERPGISVFHKDKNNVYRTYSTYSRGLDIFNGAYNFLDIVPKGRDEKKDNPAEWLRHHDNY